MSSKYIIGPLEETDMLIDVDALKGALQARWPEAHIRKVDETHSSIKLECYAQAEEHNMYVALSRDRQAIFLEGGLNDSIEAAIWLRGFVPAVYPLFLYDSGFHFHIELTSSTTKEDVIAAL